MELKNTNLITKSSIFYVLVSNSISSGEKYCKYFTDYLYDDYKIKVLPIMLLKTSAYVKNYDDQTKWMYFLIKKWWPIR